MHRLIRLIGFAGATLALALAPAIAGDFTHSTLTPGEQSVPGTYDITAVTITQNVSATITAGASVSCNNGAPNFNHTANSYWRRFDLNGAHGITGCFTASQVDFGIEEAVGGGASQPVSVRLYTIPNASPLNTANLTLIGSVGLNVPSQSLTIFSALVAGVVIDASLLDLVVEVFTPSGQTVGDRFFIGSNSLGQTAPSYLSAAECGVLQPTNTAALGFPGMHVYMAVTGGECPTPTIAKTWGSLKTIYR